MKSKNSRGFTLIEVMIVVTIIAILSSVVVVSFGSFADTFQLQKTAEVIEDRLAYLKLETIQGDYQQNTVSFLPHFLMINSQQFGSSLDFELKGFGLAPCFEDEVTLSVGVQDEPVYVSRRDEEGQVLEVVIYDDSGVYCVDFNASEAMEWNFQAASPSGYSDAIRFIHFNLDRSLGADLVELISQGSYALSFQSPYGQARAYLEGQEIFSDLQFTLKNAVDTLEWGYSF